MSTHKNDAHKTRLHLNDLGQKTRCFDCPCYTVYMDILHQCRWMPRQLIWLGTIQQFNKLYVTELFLLCARVTFLSRCPLSSGQSAVHERSCIGSVSVMTFDTAKTLIHVFISSHLYYCKQLAVWCQRRLAEQAPSCSERSCSDGDESSKVWPHHTGASWLHWLPVHQKIKYKLATTVYKSTWLGANVLSDDCLAISTIAGKWHLRSAGTGSLSVPRTRTTHRTRSLAVAGPFICNSLPTALWSETLFPLLFTRHLKAHLFSSLTACLRLFMTRSTNPLIINGLSI